MGKLTGNTGTAMHLQALKGKTGPDPNKRDKRKCYHYSSIDGLCDLKMYRCPGSSYCNNYEAEHIQCQIIQNGEVVYDSIRPTIRKITKFTGTKYIDIKDIKVDKDYLDDNDYRIINRILNIYESDNIPWNAPPISVVIRDDMYSITSEFHLFMALKIAGCISVRAQYGEKQEVSKKDLLKKAGTKWKYKTYGICESEGTYKESLYLKIPGKGTMVYELDDIIKDPTLKYVGKEHNENWLKSTYDILPDEDLLPILGDYIYQSYSIINCNIFVKCLIKNINPAIICDVTHSFVLDRAKRSKANHKASFMLGDGSNLSDKQIRKIAQKLECDFNDLYSDDEWEWSDVIKHYINNEHYFWDECTSSADGNEFLLESKIFHCTGKDILLNEVNLLLCKRFNVARKATYTLAFSYGIGRSRSMGEALRPIKIIEVYEGYWADYAEKCFKLFPKDMKEIDDSLFEQ